MVRVQGSPDNHYMFVVAPRARAERRPLRASNLDRAGATFMDQDGHGSIAKAFLIGIPLSMALWAPLIWGAAHIF